VGGPPRETVVCCCGAPTWVHAPKGTLTIDWGGRLDFVKSCSTGRSAFVSFSPAGIKKAPERPAREQSVPGPFCLLCNSALLPTSCPARTEHKKPTFRKAKSVGSHHPYFDGIFAILIW